MIYIDASRYNNTARRTGVENYSVNLIQALVKHHAHEITLISPRTIDLPVAQHIIPFPRFWTHLRLSAWVWKKRLPQLFVPSHVLPLICPKRAVITIHDVAFKRFPESYTAFSRFYLDWAARFAAKKASAILVPSAATREDLIHFYGIKKDRIHVTPLGMHPRKKQVEKKSKKMILERWGLSAGRYFLYLGRLEHKKNTDTLLKAFAQFKQSEPGLPLVLAGFLGQGGAKIIEQMPESVRTQVQMTGYIDGEEKEALMSHALAFVFPSRYEGFGLPLLEAMQHDLPIIASDIPSSREILGKNGFFFQVEEVSQLAEKMKELVHNPQKAREMTQAYPQLLKHYSWEECGKQTWKVLLKNAV